MTVRITGPLQGYTPRVEKPVAPRPSTFRAPHERDPKWRDRAACRDDDDPDLWFPLGNTGPAMLQIADAKARCFGCDVIDACGSWALTVGMDHGVWGGMSEDDRRSLKRRVARVRQKAAAEVEQVSPR